MKKLIAILLMGFAVSTIDALADNYLGGGMGLTEACYTDYEPSFSGGDCDRAGLLLRGVLGHEWNDYFAFEASLDAGLFMRASRLRKQGRKGNLAFLTLGTHVYGFLPLTDAVRLFVAPALGTSMVRADIGEERYIDNEIYPDEVDSEFGVNYGWSAGLEIVDSSGANLRIQWQNWRSLDSKDAFDGEFNTNLFSLNLIVRR